jgi:hypothetical protein
MEIIMPQSANITSIDAVAGLKAALVQFDAEVHDALVQLMLQARRSLDWIEHDRAQYWPREVRKATDVVSEAQLALRRCESTVSGERPSCYDERKALEKAKRRLERAETAVAAVRRWRLEIRKELEAQEVQSAKLQHYLETDLVRGVASLARMSEALAQYAEAGGAALDGADTRAAAEAP